MHKFSATLLLFAVFAAQSHWAAGSVRVGDASHVYALQRHAEEELAIERRLLGLIDVAPDGDRFNLYRAFNQLTGTWSQIEFLNSLLEASIEAAPSEESSLRAMLRDQAQFVLREIEEAQQHSMNNEADSSILEFLQPVRLTIEELQAEEQARPSLH